MEYRGYDSAGISFVNEKIEIYKNTGFVSDLIKKIPKNHEAKNGIGHTRWATHGKPTEKNAHPHLDCNEEVSVVHNGIIENYLDLKEELQKKNHKFISDTDTEVIPHLIEENNNGDIIKAINKVIKIIKGSYAITVISKNNPSEVYGVRMKSPLILGIGKNEHILASDVPAILPYANKVIYLEDGEIVRITPDEYNIFKNGEKINKEIQEIEWDIKSAEKSGYKHFTLKEIHEQPRVIRDTISGRIDEVTGKIIFNELNNLKIHDRNKIVISAMGSSLYAGMIIERLIEEQSGIYTKAVSASELISFENQINTADLVIAISQSGETADTLETVKMAREAGVPTLAITNVLGSNIEREADYVLFTRAGPEIGVAATKSFTAQIALGYLLALYFSIETKTIEPNKIKQKLKSILHVPRGMMKILGKKERIAELAKKYHKEKDFFYMGRGVNLPIALEGALKLKEISYIHAEGIASGDLKHGPLALLDRNVPVISLIPIDKFYRRNTSTIKQIKARDAPVIAITYDRDKEMEKFVDDVIRIPEIEDEDLSTLYNIVALQLFSYYIADYLKRDIDKPRNLAKSVTVE